MEAERWAVWEYVRRTKAELSQTQLAAQRKGEFGLTRDQLSQIVSDMIAVMAQVLDEDTTKALTQTPTWTAYLDSRRTLEKTKADAEKFAEILKSMKPEEDAGTRLPT